MTMTHTHTPGCGKEWGYDAAGNLAPVEAVRAARKPVRICKGPWNYCPECDAASSAARKAAREAEEAARKAAPFPGPGTYSSRSLPRSARTGDIERSETGYVRCTVLARGTRVRLVAADEAAWLKRPLVVTSTDRRRHLVGDIVETTDGTFRVAKVTRTRYHEDAGYLYFFRGPRFPDEAAVERARRRHRPSALAALEARLEGGEYDASPPDRAECVIPRPEGRGGYGDAWYVSGRDAIRVRVQYDFPVYVSRVPRGAKELRRIAKL